MKPASNLKPDLSVEKLLDGLLPAVTPCENFGSLEAGDDCSNHGLPYAEMCSVCKKFWDWAVSIQKDDTITVDQLIAREGFKVERKYDA